MYGIVQACLGPNGNHLELAYYSWNYPCTDGRHMRGGEACTLSQTSLGSSPSSTSYQLWSPRQVISLSEPHFSYLRSRNSIYFLRL